MQTDSIMSPLCNFSDTRVHEGEAVRRDTDRELKGGRMVDGGVHAVGLLGVGGPVGRALL